MKIGIMRSDGLAYEAELHGADKDLMIAESWLLLEALCVGGKVAYDAALKQCPQTQRFIALMRDDTECPQTQRFIALMSDDIEGGRS